MILKKSVYLYMFGLVYMFTMNILNVFVPDIFGNALLLQIDSILMTISYTFFLIFYIIFAIIYYKMSKKLFYATLFAIFGTLMIIFDYFRYSLSTFNIYISGYTISEYSFLSYTIGALIFFIFLFNYENISENMKSTLLITIIVFISVLISEILMHFHIYLINRIINIPMILLYLFYLVQMFFITSFLKELQ